MYTVRMAIQESLTGHCTGSNAPPTWRHLDETRRQRTGDRIVQVCTRSHPVSTGSLLGSHLARKLFFRVLLNPTNCTRKIFGWDFDSLATTILSQLSKAMYAAAHPEGVESLPAMVETADWDPGMLRHD